MIRTILWDIDATLLNFQKSEEWALQECFAAIGIHEITEDFIARYKKINHSYWHRLEKGEVAKKEVLEGRFRDFFLQEGIEGDGASFNAMYQNKLGERVFPNDNGIELCRHLKGKYKQYAASNGTAIAQHKKLKLSGLDEIFDGVFISEEVGYEKPSSKFYDAIFATIGEDQRATTVMVGDSLTSDMKGANNAGIPCVWYNPEKLENQSGLAIDLEIQNLWELEEWL